jgi:hypothetical protein
MRLFKLPFLLVAAAMLSLSAPSTVSAQTPECQATFNDLMGSRGESIKRIQGIGEKQKKSPSVSNARAACSEFSKLVSADQKVVSWIESEGSWCGIGEAMLSQAKTALDNSQKQKGETCGAVSKISAQQKAAESCNGDFVRLSNARNGTLGQLNKLSAAQKKNATPQRVIQACSLLGTLVSREAALGDWVKKNAKRCNIPGKLTKQLAASSSSTRKSRTQACGVAQKIKSGQAQAAKQAAARPRAPTNFDPTVGGPGVPSSAGGGVKLPGGAL